MYSNKSSPITTPIFGVLVLSSFEISNILFAAPIGFAAPIFEIIFILCSRHSSKMGFI